MMLRHESLAGTRTQPRRTGESRRVALSVSFLPPPNRTYHDHIAIRQPQCDANRQATCGRVSHIVARDSDTILRAAFSRVFSTSVDQHWCSPEHMMNSAGFRLSEPGLAEF